MSNAKHRVGVVFSTNPDYDYQYDNATTEQETLPPDKQRLKVRIDTHARGGKTVTLVSGFVGSDDDLQRLGKTLKTHCGAGGSAKDGVIIVQGSFKDKIVAHLAALGYHAS